MNIVFEGSIEGMRSLKDGSLKVSLETQELTPYQYSQLFQFKGVVKILISDSNIEKDVISAVDDLKIVSDGNKTESERMRAVLYRLWESNNEGFEDFTTFYKSRMERLINQIKERI